MRLNSIKSKVAKIVEARSKANKIEDIVKKAEAYSKNVKPYLNDIRNHIDELELIVDDEMWTLPKYRELLFTR